MVDSASAAMTGCDDAMAFRRWVFGDFVDAFWKDVAGELLDKVGVGLEDFAEAGDCRGCSGIDSFEFGGDAVADAVSGVACPIVV